MKKRGQIQFNLIFVLVTGAIILAFFAGFIVKYKSLQDHKLDAEVARGIDQIIGGVRGTTLYKNFTTEIPFDLVFSCGKFRINEFEQDITGTVFASKNIKTDNVFTWTKEWKYPFRIDDVVYFIDGNRKYFLESDPLNLLEEIPGPIKDNFVTSGDADVYVVFSLNSLNYFQQKGTVVYIEPAESGEVRFYENNQVYTKRHLGKEFVYGAIFSADAENYECAYTSLVNKYKNVKKIYGQKAISLAVSNSNCDYSNIANYLSVDNFNNNEILFENNKLSRMGCEVVF